MAIIYLATIFALICAWAAPGQTLMGAPVAGGNVILLPSDATILESGEKRADFPCTVTPVEPKLGFDFGYHGGYEVGIPLRAMAGNGNDLTAVFRVTPEDRPSREVYFFQKWRVPAIAEDAKGSAELHGGFSLGEGTYQINWMMRDREDRICSTRWRVSIGGRGRDSQIPLRIPAGTVIADDTDPFASELPVQRESSHPLRIAVFLHLAPHISGAANFTHGESEALMAILRSVAREPRIGSYSLVAFNLDRGEIFFRQKQASEIDFPALGNVVKQLKFGTVEMRRLLEKDSDLQFLSSLISEELTDDPPDALIFIGPKVAVDTKAVEKSSRVLGDLRCPAFYLTYTADPTVNPWRDLIGSAVKFWKGPIYTISKPRDLATAWTEVMTRLTAREWTANASDGPTGPSGANGLVPKK